MLTDPLRTSEDWTRHVARQTQRECEDVSARIWRAELESAQSGSDKPGIKDVKSAPSYVALTLQKGGELAGTITHRFLCFPDTIDPRDRAKR
jgi:hypothetical protein